ncbi:peptidyl-tRNA hydrolase [Paeniglutamicibacter cryotolerans]|uniref:peptidyl-tRNA hydrolase n=1 Tax=Paeniglutamicibacter cryotolerans TaxID=670079 RepID=A0A839QFU2_9MICC|nr:peptidyl-tRNA hydrolase [Paeniglutamicibacter cryotolerans]MBB2994760.1 peptidyl-tRNA hydrolase [Paeniglutamicibacter cryotolerans]
MTDYADREPFELVQPIILLVDREEPAGADHGIAAVALASVQAFMRDPENPAWPVWAAGAFAKSVRRADAKMFAKVLAAHPEHVLSQVGGASAAGLPPMPAQELPKLLAKLQVSGTQLPEGDPLPDAPLRIMLNASLKMSTGKSAAQAAHALFAWLIEAGQGSVDAWADAGFPLTVRQLDLTAFVAGQRSASGPVIQDAGRTEIEPGSTTAYVVAVLPRS